ncbi:hypothetical protein D4764_20G0009370 [Takifugu flavidus]|uniref:Alkylated DNA repair protein AlkB homologue 8 N-terminal domain-containing protein n=1 Tax=Takifugu flavidus TaxID=433684 RepID=A0A5C6NJ13_9TELE|nr:hypothetical protein D4764_20G0009370 [Takifugu flavidus]
MSLEHISPQTETPDKFSRAPRRPPPFLAHRLTCPALLNPSDRSDTPGVWKDWEKIPSTNNRYSVPQSVHSAGWVVLGFQSWIFSLGSVLDTNCCTSSHQSVKLIKFADDTTLIGLISNGDETAYRREVARLVSWCGHNNLQLNAQKTVEMIVDFRKVTAPLPPLALMDSPITIADSFRFLGTTITRDLKWEPTISSLIKKAQQRMFFLQKLRKLKLPPRMLAQFYTAIIESILTSSITVWYAGATARDRLRLQHVVRAAEKVIGCRLPSIQDLYISRTRRHAGRITADPSHPGHGLFSPLPSGRRLRSIRTKTSRYMNSFFPSAIRLLNTK